MNVVVTGAAGFVASYLIPLLLDHGHSVVGIDPVAPSSMEMWRTHGFAEHPDFRYVWGASQDIEHLLKLEGVLPDMVVNLGAATDVPYSARSPRHAYSQVYEASAAVAGYCTERHVRLIHYSTFSVYGRGHAQPIMESVPLHPGSPYGAAKAAVEHLINSAEETGNLDGVILRPASMFGPRERPTGLVSLLLRRARDGQVIMLEGGGRQSRDLNPVGNVVELTLATVEHWPLYPALRRIYNVGSGEEITIRDLASRCLTAFGRTLDEGSREAPPRAWEEGRVLLDNRAAQEELGYRPTISFEEEFERTVQWIAGQSKS